MVMRTSDQGLVFLMREEGVVMRSYVDSVGVRTIGVGHTAAAGGLNPLRGVKITLPEALDLLRRDIVKYENGVNRVLTVKVTQNQFDALVSFHYNTGSIARASLTKVVNRQGSAADITKAFAAWNKGGGKVLEGLVRRRAAEAECFNKGKYGPTSIGVWETFPGKQVRMDGSALLRLGKTPPPVGGLVPHGQESLEIEVVQRRLNAIGYSPGTIDGKWGGMTREAVAAFKNDRHLEGVAIIDKVLVDELDWIDSNEPNFRRPIAEARRNATPEEVAKKVPEVAKGLSIKKEGLIGAIITAITTIGSGIVDKFGDSVDWIVKAKEIAPDLSSTFWIIIGLAVAYFMYRMSQKGEDVAVEGTVAYQEANRR